MMDGVLQRKSRPQAAVFRFWLLARSDCAARYARILSRSGATKRATPGISTSISMMTVGKPAGFSAVMSRDVAGPELEVPLNEMASGTVSPVSPVSAVGLLAVSVG
jgi:hypothetical protein